MQIFSHSVLGSGSKKKTELPGSVAIVGAGPGGLAAAMLLAHLGFKVTVYEKQATIGGRNSELVLGNYRFDLGPTFLMMKYLMDELFELTGTQSSDYLDCRRLDPMYRLQFGSKTLQITGNPVRMKENIEKVFPGESSGLDRFMEKESVRFEKLYPCLQKSYGSPTDFLSLDLLKSIPSLAAGKSLYEVLSQYFQSEELRLAFTFQSKYLGMSPWECPGLFAMIPYTEHAHGIYHVMGGLSEITRAFAKRAEELGAVIRTGTPVKSLVVKNGEAQGLILEDGSLVSADQVVVNADFGHAVKNLFPELAQKKWTPEYLETQKWSCSTFMMYLGLDRVYDCDFHSIFFSDHYRKNIQAISDHQISTDFSVYVRNASILDPSLAPQGHSALYVLVPMANMASQTDWNAYKEEFSEKVLDFLETKTPYRDLRKHIQVSSIITPQDWESKYDVYRGATFNLGHKISQLLYFRPHNEFEDFSRCYLVGGGTHPGSGLPTIFESARITANLIAKKYGLTSLAQRPFQSLRVTYAE